MAVYKVKVKASNEMRLVQADTKIGAIKHVMIGEVTAEALNTNQLADAIGEGLVLEKAVSNSATASQDTDELLPPV